MNQHKCLSLASLALFCAPLAAQGSVVPYLPKSTLVAISAPDLKTTMEEFQQSAVAKMWHEEEVQTFFGDLLEFAQMQIEEGKATAKAMQEQGTFPIDPEQLLKLRVGGVTGAVTALDIGMGDFGPMPTIGVVLHIDFGDSAPTWNGLIQMGLAMLEAQAGDEMAKTESKIGDVQIVSMMPNGPGAPDMGLNVALVPNGVLICTLPEDVRSIVTNWNAKTPALGSTEMYSTMSKRVGGPGAEIEFFMRIDPFVQFGVNVLGMATEMDPSMAMVDLDGVERALVALGLRNLGAYAETGSYEGGKSVTRGFHYLGEGTGTAAPAKALDMSFLKWVPKDAVAFSAQTLDVTGIYSTLVKGLEAYDPEFARMALGQLAKIEEQLGFSIRDDLFGSFGDHTISWSMAVSTIASMPETAMLLKVTNEEKLITVFRNAAKLSDGMVEFEEGERRGIKVYSLHVNFDPTGGMGINPFDMMTPTFSFKKGYLVVGFSVGDIKRVFKRMDREDDPKGDIRSNKEFTAVAQSIPGNVTSVMFTDWKTQFESLYQLATGLLALVPIGEEVPIDMSLLPDSGTLTQHLFASISYSTSTGDGSEQVTISPWGPEMALALSGLVGGGMAIYLGTSRF